MELDLLPPDLVEAASTTTRFLVQFEGPVKPGWRRALEDSALAVHDYLPNYAFLATLTPEARDRLARVPGVLAISPYHPALKIDPALPTSGLVEATVLGFPDVSMAELLANLRAAGATPTAYVTTRLDHVVDVVLNGEKVPAVA